MSGKEGQSNSSGGGDQSQSSSSNNNGSSSSMMILSVAAGGSYMVFAVSLIVFNKIALSVFGFPNVNIITLFQLIFSLFVLILCRWLRVISFHGKFSLSLPFFLTSSSSSS